MSWRPIDTAPKDSRSRLVFCPSNLCVFLVCWGTHFGDKPEDDEPSWMIFGGNNTPLYTKPTHWMPLPEPPNEA